MFKNKKWRFLLTFMLIGLCILSACGARQGSDSITTGSTSSEYKPGSAQEENQQGTVQEEEQNQEEQVEEITLTFYYVDEELLSIKEKEKSITYANEEEKWTALWQELQNADQEGVVSLWKGIELIEAKEEDGLLTLNLAKPEQLQFGSTAEGFAIQTLLQTVGQIEGIKAIQILIDGNVEETLAGHVSIDQPIEVDEIIYSG